MNSTYSRELFPAKGIWAPPTKFLLVPRSSSSSGQRNIFNKENITIRRQQKLKNSLRLNSFLKKGFTAVNQLFWARTYWVNRRNTYNRATYPQCAIGEVSQRVLRIRGQILIGLMEAKVSSEPGVVVKSEDAQYPCFVHEMCIDVKSTF